MANTRKRKTFLIVLTLGIWSAFTLAIAGQELPNKIRGYKVHNEVVILQSDGKKDNDGRPYIVVGSPTISDVSLGGVTLAIVGELQTAGYDGRVEMMSFRDFRVNDVPVEVEEFNTPFTVSKKGKTVLPAPATVFLPTSNILNAAWKEITASKSYWNVTGRVFVFGKFKKFGFTFKRVIPVDVRLTIKNPLAEYKAGILS